VAMVLDPGSITAVHFLNSSLQARSRDPRTGRLLRRDLRRKHGWMTWDYEMPLPGYLFEMEGRDAMASRSYMS